MSVCRLSQTVVWIRDAASNDNPGCPRGSARAPKRDCGAQSSGAPRARHCTPWFPRTPGSGSGLRASAGTPLSLARHDRERVVACLPRTGQNTGAKEENIRRVRRRGAQFRQLNNSRRLRCTAVRGRAQAVRARHGVFQKPGGRLPWFPCLCFPSLTTGSRIHGSGTGVLLAQHPAPASPCLPARLEKMSDGLQGCLFNFRQHVLSFAAGDDVRRIKMAVVSVDLRSHFALYLATHQTFDRPSFGPSETASDSIRQHHGLHCSLRIEIGLHCNSRRSPVFI